MKIEALQISGAWQITPQLHADDRGHFVEWFRSDALEAAVGRRFDFVQANHSVSRRGVVRGIHFADTPPGQAKLVSCTSGAVLDIVVDLRVGSPTFGKFDKVMLDTEHCRSTLLWEGLGHAFCALEENSSLTYLVSTAYNADNEHTVSPFDADLALPWPDLPGGSLLSPRDAAAPTLRQALESGALPSYDTCETWYRTP